MKDPNLDLTRRSPDPGRSRQDQRVLFCALALAIMVLLLSTPHSTASEPTADAPVIAAFERIHRAQPDVRGGERLLSELMCVRCHAPPESATWLRDRAAPRLNLVARKWTIAALAERIADPAKFKPGTTMPAMLDHLPAADREQVALDLAHFLRSSVDSDAVVKATDHPAAARGDDLFHRVGCVACHAPRSRTIESELPHGSIPLPNFSNRASIGGIAQFLRNPLVDRPAGRMPSLKLSNRESIDLAHFLLDGTDVPGPLSYWRYDRSIRDGALEERPPVETGVTQIFDPKIGRGHRYVLRFEGWMDLQPSDGAAEEDITFEVAADDGVRLWIDGAMVGEQLHRPGDKLARIRRTGTLTAGKHRIRVDSSHVRDRAEIYVGWERGGAEMTPLPMGPFEHADNVSYDESIPFDAERAARGATAFQDYACGACHENGSHQPSASEFQATPLSSLDPSNGCMSIGPEDATDARIGQPTFLLDGAQRSAIAFALRSAADTASGGDAPLRGTEDSLFVDLETWNCIACHARGGRGGVPDDRDGWFLSKGEDLGEEGRIPPDLTGVGNKLREDWLRQVVTEGATARRYFETRMPRFGSHNTEAIASKFRDNDRRGTRLPSVRTPKETLVEVGHQLVGTGGFGCITCHDFNRRDALTMGLADLITAPERLYEDWFHSFLQDPAAYRPETRMPAFFEHGRSQRRDLLGGNAHTQITAIWEFLNQGEDARDPEGLNQKGRELVVGGDIIVYRGKLWEAGWRGIAVGFPERRHVSFDAEQLRWALLWKERFLDASAHWNVQGMGRVRPLGSDVWLLPQGPGVARLESQNDAWPAPPTEPGKGRRFLGYDLDKEGRPTFRYEIAGITIEDTPRPLAAKPPDDTSSAASSGEVRMTRKLGLSASRTADTTPPYLLLARENQIEGTTTSTVKIDGRRQIVISGSNAVPYLVESNGKIEARLPLGFGPDQSSTLELEYRW